jgi:hypothetical protein
MSWYIPMIVYESTALTGLYFLKGSVVDFQLISSFIAIYAGIFIGSEFANRTFGIAVSAGNTRFSIFFSKIIVFFIGSLPMLISNATPMVFLTSIMNGFAPQLENPHLHIIHGPEGASNIIHGDLMLNYMASIGVTAYTIRTIILSLLLTLVIGCLHILLAMCIKNVAGTIGAGIFITFLFEHLQRFYVGEQRFREIWQDIFTHRAELTPIFVGVCVVLIAVMLYIALKVFQKTELK